MRSWSTTRAGCSAKARWQFRAELGAIFDRLGTDADGWWARIAKPRRGRFFGRVFAATRQRSQEVASRLGDRRSVNLGRSPAQREHRSAETRRGPQRGGPTVSRRTRHGAQHPLGPSCHLSVNARPTVRAWRQPSPPDWDGVNRAASTPCGANPAAALHVPQLALYIGQNECPAEPPVAQVGHARDMEMKPCPAGVLPRTRRTLDLVC